MKFEFIEENVEQEIDNALDQGNRKINRIDKIYKKRKKFQKDKNSKVFKYLKRGISSKYKNRNCKTFDIDEYYEDDFYFGIEHILDKITESHNCYYDDESHNCYYDDDCEGCIYCVQLGCDEQGNFPHDYC